MIDAIGLEQTLVSGPNVAIFVGPLVTASKKDFVVTNVLYYKNNLVVSISSQAIIDISIG